MAIEPECDMLTLRVNGADVSVPDVSDVSLLNVLRDHLGLTAAKNGCQPMGQCGCCTVLMDGKPRLSCTLKPAAAAGKEITTLEGLSDEERTQIAEAFVLSGGVQCGFCIPGIAVRSQALLDKNASPTRDEIEASLRPHLCRCTGYRKIVDAVELLGRARRGESIGRADHSGRLGTSLPRYAGADAVLGDRPFIDDISIPGGLFAAMRFSDHPRALVKRIDTTEAEALDGVFRVATFRDVPGDRYVGLIVPDWPTFVAEGEETRFIGDVMAAVAAVDEVTARRAAAMVKIEYEVLEPITDPREALKNDAPKIHPKGNLLSRSALERGDVEQAFAASAHIVEGEWHTQRIEHMYLEPESCIAIPVAWRQGHSEDWQALLAEGRLDGVADLGEDDLGLHVLTQGQGVFDDRRQCCGMLGWQPERMHVELISNGGAFGGKEDMSIQAQTCLLSVLTRMPVKSVLNRFESMRLHPKRHPISIQCKVGCNTEGRLTALQTRSIGDTGAYASVGAKVLERAGGHSSGPYRFPAVSVEALAVYTNNLPCGAMRGFGANQAAFAIEACLDMLAAKVGIDGWEIRNRNILERGDTFCTGQKLDKPIGLRKTLEAVKEVYRRAKYAGIACGIKNVGVGNGLPEAGRASITVEDNGRLTIRSGFTEMGQGLFTVLIQTAVEETALAPDLFDATTDTRDALDCGQTTASRGTVLGCHAVREASRKLRADLDAGKSLGDLAGKVYAGTWHCFKTDKFGAEVENPKTHLSYGYATQVVILDDEGRLEKVVAAHDVGRVMNPLQLEGQIEGSIHMGLGYALTEDMEMVDGELVARDIKACGVLRAHQMPEMEVIFVEEADPDCPYGARGVGEIGLVPTAPAVAAALHSYDGIRRYRLPMKDAPAAQLAGKPRK